MNSCSSFRSSLLRHAPLVLIAATSLVWSACSSSPRPVPPYQSLERDVLARQLSLSLDVIEGLEQRVIERQEGRIDYLIWPGSESLAPLLVVPDAAQTARDFVLNSSALLETLHQEGSRTLIVAGPPVEPASSGKASRLEKRAMLLTALIEAEGCSHGYHLLAHGAGVLAALGSLDEAGSEGCLSLTLGDFPAHVPKEGAGDAIDLRSLLPRLKMPVLIVRGRESLGGLLDRQAMREYDALEHRSLIEPDNVGHEVFADPLPGVHRQVLHHIQRAEAASAPQTRDEPPGSGG